MYSNIYYVIYYFLNKIIFLKKIIQRKFLFFSLVVSSSKHAMKTTLFSTIFNQVFTIDSLKVRFYF